MSELAPGETASGEGVMFSELKEHSEEWLANSNGIAAVLATSLLLEFKLETLDYAILGVLATLTVVSVVVPFVIPGAVAATAVACTLRALPGKETSNNMYISSCCLYCACSPCEQSNTCILQQAHR